MSKAGNVRVKPTKIEIDGKTYELKYNFNAFIELEDIYGSVDKAMEIVQGEKLFEEDEKTGEVILDEDGNKKPIMVEEIDENGKKVYEEDGSTPKMVQKRKTSLKAIRNLLWCGLLHSNENITEKQAGELMEFANFKYIIEKLMEAITASMPKTVDDEGKN